MEDVYLNDDLLDSKLQNILYANKAVSYTHLDVYKRQVLVCKRYAHKTWVTITHTNHDAYAVVVLESNE